MNILYVTSFTARMYELTGTLLLESFLRTNSDGNLLICREGELGTLKQTSERVTQYDLGQSQFLKDWLAVNRDLVPVSLGGTASACQCDGPDDPWTGHQQGCVFQWFNKNASRWFRKIVSLDFALSDTHCDAIIWIDCDCQFLKKLPSTVFEKLFENTSVLYHKSLDRSVVETGVIGFKCDFGGRTLLERVINRFRSGEFRQDLRWDDGYQFQIVIDASKDVRSKDLGKRADPQEHGMGHVLPSGPLGEYIRHLKGVHSMLRLMT